MDYGTCEERISDSLKRTLEDLRLLWEAYNGQAGVCDECIGLEEIECPACEGRDIDDCDICDEAGVIPCPDCADYLDRLDDLGGAEAWPEYGLCFDYVPAGTFTDQDQGYFRYQLSWGGPADEFRFYVDADLTCYRVEYWYLDWSDGACRTLYDSDKDLLLEIFDFFKEVGTVEAELESAREA